MRVIIGFHAIEEVLRKQYANARLYVHRAGHKRNDHLIKLAQENSVPVTETDPRELDAISGGTTHRGAVLTLSGSGTVPKSVSFTKFLAEDINRERSVVVVLDGVTDPQNLGAVMRSADMFGIDLLILPERRSAAVNQTVMKVSSGAAEHVPYAVVPNIVRALQELKSHGYWVYGTDLQGEAVDAVNLTGKTVIVLGAEGRGISSLVAKNCDRLVTIPTDGHIDSLNISVAAGILMYEIKRQSGTRN